MDDTELITVPQNLNLRMRDLHFAPPTVLTPILIKDMETTIPRMVDLIGELGEVDCDACKLLKPVKDCPSCALIDLFKAQVKVG